MKLQPIVNLLPDKGRLMDFLLQRKECKMVILAVCSQSKGGSFLSSESSLCCPTFPGLSAACGPLFT